MQIYQPAEDSYLLADVLKEYFQDNKDISYLDMGTGSGILSEIAKESGVGNILAVDINSSAVEAVKDRGFDAIESNLFENVFGEFDVISFNAPYLPEDLREPEDSRFATTGGKDGDEIAVRFLEDAKRYLTKGGKIFLLVSSLTPMDKINKYNPEIVAKKRVFTEDLIVLRFDN